MMILLNYSQSALMAYNRTEEQRAAAAAEEQKTVIYSFGLLGEGEVMFGRFINGSLPKDF